jgi:hypothetical protein
MVFRQFFSENTLKELDATAYEEAPPLTHEEALQEMERRGTGSPHSRHSSSLDGGRLPFAGFGERSALHLRS